MNNTKYNRSYHLPFSLGTTSDDKISNDVSFLENNKIVLTEKLDGQNSSLTKGGVYARSHSTYTQNPWDRELWNLHNKIKNSLSDDEFVFGESMFAIHSLEYKKLEHYFYIFGIRINGEYLSWDDVEEYSYCLDIPTVPVLFKGETMDIKKTVLSYVDKPSIFDSYDILTDEEIMGGCVVRNYNSFKKEDFSKNLDKYVRNNHVKTNEHWTKNWKRQKLKFEHSKF